MNKEIVLCFFFVLLSYTLLLLVNQYSICKKYVELSASSIHYITYLPVVVKAWEKIGFCSIVMIIYHNLSHQIVFVEQKLKVTGCKVIMLKIYKNMSLNYVSKITRIFGFEINKNHLKNDFFLLSDSDMLPISSKFFRDLNYNKLTIKSFDSNGYGFGMNKGRWAICYMVANLYIWKDILKRDIVSNDIKSIIYRVIRDQILKGERYFESYEYIDEVYIRDRIKDWRYFNSNVLFHKRNYKKTRIDRSAWPNDLYIINLSRIIDIHLPKLHKNAAKIWKEKIIPLQQLIFKYIPYDMNYINSLYSL